jgi:hypothetical protein
MGGVVPCLPGEADDHPRGKSESPAIDDFLSTPARVKKQGSPTFFEDLSTRSPMTSKDSSNMDSPSPKLSARAI